MVRHRRYAYVLHLTPFCPYHIVELAASADPHDKQIYGEQVQLIEESLPTGWPLVLSARTDRRKPSSDDAFASGEGARAQIGVSLHPSNG